MKIKLGKNRPNYDKIGKELEEMLYGSYFDCPSVHKGKNNQLPIIIKALSIFLATADGNAFPETQDSYANDAKEILAHGIKQYIKNHKLDNLEYDFGMKDSLKDCLKELETRKEI